MLRSISSSASYSSLVPLILYPSSSRLRAMYPLMGRVFSFSTDTVTPLKLGAPSKERFFVQSASFSGFSPKGIPLFGSVVTAGVTVSSAHSGRWSSSDQFSPAGVVSVPEDAVLLCVWLVLFWSVLPCSEAALCWCVAQPVRIIVAAAMTAIAWILAFIAFSFFIKIVQVFSSSFRCQSARCGWWPIFAWSL